MLKICRNSSSRGLVFNVILTLCLPAFALAACDKKSSKKSEEVIPSRSGTAFVSYSQKFTDEHPSLSDDGTKLVFISGRDSEEANPVMKAYKLSWAKDAAPDASTVARVTSSDLGRELKAVVSPDGSMVAILSAKDGETSLYVQAYDTEGGERLVSKTSNSIDKISFSSDSKLLMWLDQSVSTVQVKLASIGSGTDAIAEPTALSAVTFATDVVWIPVDSGYQIAVSQADTTDSTAATDISSFAFTGTGDFAAATATSMLKSSYYNKSVAMVAGTGTVSFVEKVPASSKQLVSRYGKVDDPQPTIPVRNRMQWFQPQASATADRTTDDYAYDITSLGMGANGASIFTLTKTYYLCEDDSAATYGSDLVQVDKAAKTVTRYVPRLNSEGNGFELASGLCDNKDVSETRRRMDDRITEFAIDKPTSATAFRYAYVTRISTKFDANCSLKLGDPDIYLVDVNGDTKTIYYVSGNQATIESDARPSDAEPCNLQLL